MKLVVNPKVSIPSVCERDMDLMLLEELVASSDFRSWFLSQLGIDDDATLVEASHSVDTQNGESDLELTFQGFGGGVKILIEDKIDAPFQPNQAQRYLERAEGYRASGLYAEVVTVLVAPKVYFGNDAENLDFDAKVTDPSSFDGGM